MDNNTIPTIVHDDDESIFQKKILKIVSKISSTVAPRFAHSLK